MRQESSLRCPLTPGGKAVIAVPVCADHGEMDEVLLERAAYFPYKSLAKDDWWTWDEQREAFVRPAMRALSTSVGAMAISTPGTTVKLSSP